MKALVGTFNQEKAQVGAFSMIVKTNGLFAALPETVAPLPAVHRLESPWVHAVVTVLLR